MEPKRTIPQYNLKLTSLKLESKFQTKASSEDLNSTRDQRTPSTSPLLELKNFTLGAFESPIKPEYSSFIKNQALKRVIDRNKSFPLSHTSNTLQEITLSNQETLVKLFSDTEFYFKNWGFPTYLSDTYEILEEIGRGHQGITYKIRDKNSHVCYVAKKINCSDDENIYSIQNEISILKQMSQNPFIIHYHDEYYDKENAVYWILMEYFPSQTLLAFLKAQTEPIPDSFLKNILFQILSAVEELHKLNIAHRDLNLENILIYDSEIKLIDFGVSKQISSCQKYMFSPVGHLNYRAPEHRELGSYSLNYDVWQIGLIFIQLIKRERMSTKKTLKLIKAGGLNEIFNEKERKLLSGMLESDSEIRLSCKEALSNGWLREQ